MSFLARLFGRNRVVLDEDAARRVAAWRALPETKGREHDAAAGRFVVVDVETTGLNLAKDRLISIAAIAMTGRQIRLGETYETILKQDAASAKENILLHGIGGTAQTEGESPVDALLGFLEFVGKDPLVAYHAAFDEGMSRKAVQKYLGLKFQHRWLDLAFVAPGLYPELATRFRALDDWTGYFDIPNYARHNAMADSLATAQLGLIVFNRAQQKGVGTLQGLQDLDHVQRMRQHYRA
jgi:DNA polymerase-3 subunit epsilon